MKNNELLGRNKVCAECIGNKTLSRTIEKTGKVRKCSYCNEKTKTRRLKWLANQVKSVVLEQFEPTPNQSDPDGLMSIDELKETVFFRDGWEVQELVEEVADCSASISADIKDLVDAQTASLRAASEDGENPFGDDIRYEERAVDHERYHRIWNKFLLSLTQVSRFSNVRALEALDAIFSDIDLIQCKEGHPINRIRDSSELALFRARKFDALKVESALNKPVQELGPPPASIVGAGRMNIQGIPVFYGATEADTAVAEIRPPVGSTVVVGQFRTTRPVHLIDMFALRTAEGGSDRFEKRYKESWERAYFLRKLCDWLTAPVIDPEGYSPSQAVAEYFSDCLDIDGIMYPSAQIPGGKNIAFFYRSSKVQSIDYKVKVGSDITQVSENDFKHYYTLSAGAPVELDTNQSDNREPCLILDLDSIRIVSIESVKFGSQIDYRVRCESEEIRHDFG